VTDQKRGESTPAPKRPTQRSNETSLMIWAVVGGLVFMVLGAAVAIWIFVVYSK
jgi:hypothetical protein